jgi:YbbR domain-containing protein
MIEMLNLLRSFARTLPTLLFALVLAIAVWVTSVTQADPNREQIYPRPVPVQVIGQDPGTVLTSETPKQVIITINAPLLSVWTRLNNEDNLVTATIDLSGLSAGTHSVRVEPAVNVRPSEIISVSPQSINITLERLVSKSLSVHLVTLGEPAIGFQAGTPTLSATSVTVSGPESQTTRVQEIRATLDLSQVHESIARTINLQPLDSGENVVTGVTLSPDKVDIQLPITQRYGFRTVSVKVVVTGQVASGYRVTNISVFPLAVTVSSTDPQRVNDLPGFVETDPVNIDSAKNDLDVRVLLNLPDGVKVEGDQYVLVQVGITSIDSNVTINSLAVEASGLAPGLSAVFSPNSVDIILSGPLPVLDTLTGGDLHVLVDLTDKGPGTYQVTPTIQLANTDLRVVSILPATLEVTIVKAPTPTPTKKP